LNKGGKALTGKDNLAAPGAGARSGIAGVFDRIIDVLAYSSGALVLFMMVLIAADVVLRKLTGFTFGWSTEFTENAVCYVTFTTAAWLARQNRHVVVDIVVSQLNSRNRNVLNTATSILAAATCLFMAYHASRTTLDVWRRHVTTATIMEVPMAPLIAIIAVGMLLLSIQFMRNAHFHIRQVRGRPSSTESVLGGHEELHIE
jgi:TRAP-type C4-dicarboxylate transport system permease small subunit